MIARNFRTFVGAAALLVAILATSCSSSSSTGDSSTESAAPPPAGAPTIEQAREAGIVARAIENEPNRMSEILAQHGMTAESLETLMFEIAKDPELTEAYEVAKRAPSSG